MDNRDGATMTDELPPFFVRKNPTLGLYELIDWRTKACVQLETAAIHYHHLLVMKDKLNANWAKEQERKDNEND